MMGPIIDVNDVALLDVCIPLSMIIEAQLTLGLSLALYGSLLYLLRFLCSSSRFLLRWHALSWLRDLEWIFFSGSLACPLIMMIFLALARPGSLGGGILVSAAALESHIDYHHATVHEQLFLSATGPEPLALPSVLKLVLLIFELLDNDQMRAVHFSALDLNSRPSTEDLHGGGYVRSIQGLV